LIISVPELRQYISTDVEDQALEARLQALELLIRGNTNNNFQVKGTGRIADVVGGFFTVEALNPYKVGDTIHVSGSDKNDGLYTIKEADDNSFRVNEPTRDEIDIFVTLVDYPADVKMGVIELLKYDLENRKKVSAGIQSETISRHSVTYKVPDKSDTVKGYPQHLMGFLERHMKARFGQGVRA
jgi:hypothetical protein